MLSLVLVLKSMHFCGVWAREPSTSTISAMLFVPLLIFLVIEMLKILNADLK